MTSKLQSSRQISVNARFFSTRNLSILVLGLFSCVAVIKADSKDIPKIVETIVGSSKFGLLGWIFATIILAGSIIMIKVLCHVYDKEIERIARERDQLQQRLLESREKL